ncbi:MAG: hypothetical protein JXR96_12605 [Deltaproteobacteria bacterium]|nr:hypothetical protein [Deltaproteobacteria bacterium]
MRSFPVPGSRFPVRACPERGAQPVGGPPDARRAARSPSTDGGDRRCSRADASFSALAWLLLASACAGLPSLRPLAEVSERARLAALCEAAYPRQAFQAVHAIQADLPGGRASSLIGAVDIDPREVRFRAVLVSVEGLTLFDASLSRSGIEILRAVAPLDDPAFGRGLVDDVALLLLAPGSAPAALGRLEDGRPACRYRSPEGVLDVLPDSKGYALRRYDLSGHLLRRARLELDRTRAELEAPGPGGYRLELRLLRTSPAAAAERGATRAPPCADACP